MMMSQRRFGEEEDKWVRKLDDRLYNKLAFSCGCYRKKSVKSLA